MPQLSRREFLSVPCWPRRRQRRQRFRPAFPPWRRVPWVPMTESVPPSSDAEFAGRRMRASCANSRSAVTWVCDPDPTRADEVAALVLENKRAPAKDRARSSKSCWRTKPCTRFLSRRAITGTRWRPSGPCRPARTPMSRSRSATTSAKVAHGAGRPQDSGASARAERNTVRAARWRPPSIHPRRQARRGEAARSIVYGGRGSIGGPGKYEVPASVDYDLWAGPAPKVPLTRPKLHYDWHWVWDTGNGELGNNNIHSLDICRWGLGLTGPGARSSASADGSATATPVRRPTPRS